MWGFIGRMTDNDLVAMAGEVGDRNGEALVVDEGFASALPFGVHDYERTPCRSPDGTPAPRINKECSWAVVRETSGHEWAVGVAALKHGMRLSFRVNDDDAVIAAGLACAKVAPEVPDVSTYYDKIAGRLVVWAPDTAERVEAEDCE
jgi:hypothetical protein